MEAYLEDGLWLRLAARANEMGQRLAQGVAGVTGAALTHPAEANMVFANWAQGGHGRLQAAGAVYYDLRPMPDGRETARMVASWNTTEEHVDRFVAALRG
jgi:threonine aldolase